MQLLENGAVVETVTLGEHNHWEYTWQGLNGHSTWQVVEEQTPTGYSVCVVREGTTFVLTNTYASAGASAPADGTGVDGWRMDSPIGFEKGAQHALCARFRVVQLRVRPRQNVTRIAF